MKLYIAEDKRHRPTDVGMNEAVLDFYEAIYLREKHIIDALKVTHRVKTSLLITTGKLIRPMLCSICGKEGRIDAHHPDYRDSEAIIWVCIRCHSGRLKGMTRRRLRAIQAFVYLSGKVKEYAAYGQFMQAKDSLLQVLYQAGNVSSEEAALEWLEERTKAEQALWKAEWALKACLTRLATFYDPFTDRLY